MDNKKIGATTTRRGTLTTTKKYNKKKNVNETAKQMPTVILNIA